MPDINTKHKAQTYIGLNPEEMKKEKQIFIEEVVPIWVKKAMEREKNYPVKNY